MKSCVFLLHLYMIPRKPNGSSCKPVSLLMCDAEYVNNVPQNPEGGGEIWKQVNPPSDCLQEVIWCAACHMWFTSSWCWIKLQADGRETHKRIINGYYFVNKITWSEVYQHSFMVRSSS